MPCMCACVRVRVCTCACTQLRALPEWLGYRQAKLAVLSAPRNHLTGLPPGLAHASSLTRLDMDGNRSAS